MKANVTTTAVDEMKEARAELLSRTSQLANEFLDGVADRPVARPVDFEALLAEMRGDGLAAHQGVPLQIVEELSGLADQAVVATAGPRYFRSVVGGALPVALAADWLAATWDQNGAFFAHSPLAAAAEQVAGAWLIDLFGLSSESSVGFVTGGTMANFTGLAAGRHALLRAVGWDVEKQGLMGAPPITVVTSDESHMSIFAGLQMLGLGSERVVRVPADDQGRMRADELRRMLKGIETPILVCAQAGNVNTGSFDPIAEIVDSLRDYQNWLHVDGAFGLWAATSPAHRSLTRGIELADSVATDCHKWLNVPYDCGLVCVRDASAHQAAMSLNAPYYVTKGATQRDNCDWVPEASRRARGFTVYAALRFLGRNGVSDLVERCCRLAQRMAVRLAKDPNVTILNDVVLNQVLVRFAAPGTGGNDDELTAEVIRRVQEDGTCWLGDRKSTRLNSSHVSESRMP